MRSLFPVLIAAFFSYSVAPASAAEYDEGIEYQVIKPALRATPDNGTVEVAEVFWYGCPHCYHLEPDVDAWLARKPANVQFVRLPAPLNPSWAVHSRAFYAAEAMGVLDKIHVPLFDAIHKDKRQLFSDAALAEFFAEQGVDATEYLTTARSFGVAKEVRRAASLGRKWGVHGVPAIVVNGKYLTNVESAGGTAAKLFALIDYLVAKESPSAVPATTGPATAPQAAPEDAPPSTSVGGNG
ncbi:MAG: thiol:disulfide interchange protein DsbA/DsbL [Gammaproteobacteria bacterium]|nr:thiol:disulfide interchange protein DsbA/DsbL [Gammaproteobacteria bacterium]MCP5138108.1 thiol:disulfide interchange protein DsbA/DsbL [Gammaproteobacteria bacterium]